MEKNISEISFVPYGQDNVSCDPSKEDIEKAVKENNLDTRAFQANEREIAADWAMARLNGQDYSVVKQYHARRIAFFVVKGWKDSITLNKDGYTVKDGLHRIKAAIYLGKTTVDVIIDGDTA